AWLAPEPAAKNPTTGLRGSQVFFHDTKNGDFQLLPVAYFAERILRWRADDTTAKTRARKKALALAQKEGDHTTAERHAWHLENLRRWVFPARNPQSKAGHHTDSKAIIHNIRLDAGLLDPERGIDVGLTPHDLRRTLGRFAGRLLPGHVVSQLLNHHSDRDEGGRMAKVTERTVRRNGPTSRRPWPRAEKPSSPTARRGGIICRGPTS